MDVSSKSEASLTKEELLEEVQEFRTMMREVRAKMECPVCLTIPRDGPPPCCPRGHIVCTGCFEKIREGQGVCPTCREPMGDGKNLLAKVIIENIRHQCDLTGCKEMVLFKNYDEHQKNCQYRLVMCPGINTICSALLPFCEVQPHIENCLNDVGGNYREGGRVFELEKINLERKRAISWPTEMFKVKDELFFLRMATFNQGENLIAEMVMHADQAKCNKYNVTISILDQRKKTAYLARFHPRPIGPSNDVDDFLSVHMKSLLKICVDEGDVFSFTLRVAIKKEDQDRG